MVSENRTVSRTEKRNLLQAHHGAGVSEHPEPAARRNQHDRMPDVRRRLRMQRGNHAQHDFFEKGNAPSAALVSLHQHGFPPERDTSELYLYGNDEAAADRRHFPSRSGRPVRHPSAHRRGGAEQSRSFFRKASAQRERPSVGQFCHQPEKQGSLRGVAAVSEQGIYPLVEEHTLGI